jgi:hypothetical protein
VSHGSMVVPPRARDRGLHSSVQFTESILQGFHGARGVLRRGMLARVILAMAIHKPQPDPPRGVRIPRSHPVSGTQHIDIVCNQVRHTEESSTVKFSQEHLSLSKWHGHNHLKQDRTMTWIFPA